MAPPCRAPAARSGTGSTGSSAAACPRPSSLPCQNAPGTPERLDPRLSVPNPLRKHQQQFTAGFNTRRAREFTESLMTNVLNYRRTVQQVLGTQVDVDAAVEAGDESVENSLL